MVVTPTKDKFNSVANCLKCTFAGVAHLAEGTFLFFGGIGGLIGNVIIYTGVTLAKAGVAITNAMKDRRSRKQQLVRS